MNKTERKWTRADEAIAKASFCPTHELTLTDFDGSVTLVLVQLFRGKAYTRDQWDCDLPDWECDDAGVWTRNEWARDWKSMQARKVDES